MKKKLLIISITIAMGITGAFAFRKQENNKLRAFTVVSVHTFTPSDKTKPIIFLGAHVESYKEDGSFVHRQITATGKSSYFYSDVDGVYRATSKSREKVGSHWKPTKSEVEAKDADLAKINGFQRVDTIHGLRLSVVETFPEGRRHTQWMSTLYGPVQMEREHQDGLEQIKVISVNDGYDPAEFARIPPKQDVK